MTEPESTNSAVEEAKAAAEAAKAAAEEAARKAEELARAAEAAQASAESSVAAETAPTQDDAAEVAGPHGGKDGRPKSRSVRYLGQEDGDAGDIGVNLHEQVRTRGATGYDDMLGVEPDVAHGLEDEFRAEGDPLHHGAEDMFGPVA